MGRRGIRAAMWIVVMCFASSASGEEPPVPQEATGNWSASLGNVDTSTGAAVTSYPFALPPARGSLQPSLGLSYRHTAGPSAVGEGWSLGLPEIVLRGVAGGPPRFDGTDHYELSGQELVQCGSAVCDGELPSWASSGWQQYRGKSERSPVRVYRRTLVPAGYTWRLALPQGGFAEFGYPRAAVTTAAGAAVDRARTSSGQQIYRWNLVRLVDAAPNNVAVFVWKHTDAAQTDVSVLTEVFYTPEGNNLTALDRYAHHVSLGYEVWRRTPPSLATAPIWNRIPEQRLATVAIASRGIDPNAARERVRVYRLGYLPEPVRRHTFLESISMEGCAARQLSGEFS